MIQSVFELLRLLTPKQQKELAVLQVLVILMAFAELAGVVSIGPFMALVGNSDLLMQDNFLARIYQKSGLQDVNDFIVWVGIGALVILTVSAIVSVLTLWRLSLYGQKVGVELSDRLYEYYMHQPWLFHAAGSSAILHKKISTDVNSVANNIIQSLLSMNARIVLAVFIAVPMLIFNPVVACAGLLIFGIAYLILYQFVRQKLAQNGSFISTSNAKRFTLISEGFGGIKDVLLLGRQKNFVERFKASGKELSYSQSANQTIAQAPRYFMEVLAFASIIFLVIYLVKSYQGDLGAVLPTLAVYALAGFKLLPAFQNIYHSVAKIKSGLPSLNIIKNDLIASQNSHMHLYKVPEAKIGSMQLKDAIELKNVEFTYPGKSTPAIKSLDIKIPAQKIIGIVGATGSGKSTLIDLILGLIQPDQGEICVDGSNINTSEIRQWQNTLGFVPQSIFLANTSMMENIAFGLSLDQVDVERVERVIKLAHLEELVEQLPKKIYTVVGERGVQLSGGQRQRIGIARSLYHDAKVLILDEATSALDGITEKVIMDAIHDFSGEKTIIMIAHRFATIQKCDIIFMMEQGRVIDQGTYQELFERNSTFKRMALHA